MSARSLRNIFISVGLFFALARLLAAGTNDAVLNFNEMPRGRSQPTFITFDPPGSTGTFPSGINSAGVITGFYNVGFFNHGFVRARDGIITTFDGPNAVSDTAPSDINPAGVITGTYCDTINCHGFLRRPDGAFTTFDVPGAVFGTFPVGINEGGAVTGGYCDAVNCHSFVRSRDGTITTFDPAMVPNNSGVINPAGAITGYFFVPPTFSFARGFVRDHPKGTITIFEAPNVCQTENGTFATGINARGLVVGTYEDANCETFHGFLRSPDGAFTTIDVPGAVATECDAINPGGAISGVYFTSSAFFGFLRSPNGNFTTYSAPAGSFGPNDKAISPTGAITGFYSDANGVSHGYLWSAK